MSQIDATIGSVDGHEIDEQIERKMRVEAKNQQPLPQLGDEDGTLRAAEEALNAGYFLARGLPD